jgi:CRISPR/Cas system-associated exonuclease Cas4 (RecB family)
MRADDGDPWVSVSLLGESLFCDRAGRFQYEQSQEDTGEESDIAPPRRGWYRPPFSISEIEGELARLRPRVGMLFAVAAVALAAACLLVSPQGVGLGSCLLFLGGGLVTVQAVRATIAFVALGALLAEARAAHKGEPDPSRHEPQEVSWWSLLANGFEVQRYEDKLSEPHWRVTGKPWRVLHRGSVRVPVFRKRNEEKKVFRQHFARVAAYAYLIEMTTGAEVPYGIVLLGSSYRGLAIMIDNGSKKPFFDGLGRAREIIRSGQWQSEPESGTKCRACPWGKPMTTNRGITYHSTCGDRYGWVPPHQKAFLKRLV